MSDAPSPLINSQRVEEIFLDCLFKDGEPTDKHVLAEGLTCTVGFHPQRLEDHKEEVKQILNNLPGPFFPVEQGGGGGWAFSNVVLDKNETQWTDFQLRAEQLLQLGIGMKMVMCLAPREMWSILPNGMPYYLVSTSGLPDSKKLKASRPE